MKTGLKLIIAGLFVTIMSCEKNVETLIDQNLDTILVESLASADYQYDNYTGLTARDPKHHGKRDSIRHGKGGEGLVITFGELPQTAQDYITTNYSKDNVRRIVKVTEPDGTVRYIVALKDGTHLYFDANGNFVEKRTRDDKFMEITFGDLSQAAQATVLAKFDTANIVHYYKVTLRDGTTGFVIRFADGKVILIDNAGVILDRKKRKK